MLWKEQESLLENREEPAVRTDESIAYKLLGVFISVAIFGVTLPVLWPLWAAVLIGMTGISFINVVMCLVTGEYFLPGRRGGYFRDHRGPLLGALCWAASGLIGLFLLYIFELL